MAEANPVVQRDATIETTDGAAAAKWLLPSRPGAFPGVLFLTDIGGVRPAVTARAERLAAAGYSVLLPNAFYRNGSPPFFPLPVNLQDETTRRRFQDIAAAMTPEAIERDTKAYVNTMTSSDFVQPGPVAVVGHCFTGAVALRMAAAQPEDVTAVASFHGGGLFIEGPTSPHLVLPRIKARLYFGHAVDDASMPTEAIASFNRALEQWGGAFTSEIYQGALHGWTMPGHPCYNLERAELAFQRLTSFLADTLPQRT